MKAFLIAGGLFLIVFTGLIPFTRDIREYQTQKSGELVTARITYLPKCLGTRINHFMKFTYEGEEFDLKVGCGFADTHKVGDNIIFRHTAGTDIFLFEYEQKESALITTVLLILTGIIFIIIGARKNK